MHTRTKYSSHLFYDKNILRVRVQVKTMSKIICVGSAVFVCLVTLTIYCGIIAESCDTHTDNVKCTLAHLGLASAIPVSLIIVGFLFVDILCRTDDGNKVSGK